MKEKDAKKLKHLEYLLELEKQEDFEQYKEKIRELPLPQRKEKGFSWHPLDIVRQGYTVGERAFVIVQRTTNLDEVHHFRSGMPVSLFTHQKDAFQPDKLGVVYYADDNKMKIVLTAKDLPEWIGGGNIGVDVLFDDRTYLEMARALNKVSIAKRNRLAELRSILLGSTEALFSNLQEKIEIPSLNPSQNKAVNQILEAKDVAVIHGPPGTGKTTTLVQAIKLLCKRENTVLVTAPSNTAVDLLTERLNNEQLNVIRIGNLSRVDEKLIEHTLEYRVSKHPEMKMIKKVRLQAVEVRRKVRRLGKSFSQRTWEERHRLKREAKELSSWANRLEDQLIDQILDNAQVIACTLVSSTHKVLARRTFKTLVIDEAAQALEPATWIPILKASKVILAGDPFQLPPTVKSQKAKKGGLGVTLLEKCIQFLPKVSLLNVQYRMNEKIMNYSNQVFYEEALKADESVKNHQLSIKDNCPIIFIDTVGCGFEEKINEERQSRYNPDEFQILCEHLYQLMDAFEEDNLPNIAIISPYREQVIYMKKIVREDKRLSTISLTINTIDGFQGQESDVVYISLVRSNAKGEIGFLKDYRRMNVAMTRARKQLIVVGDSATVGRDNFYSNFLDYVDANGEYRTAWEYMQ